MAAAPCPPPACRIPPYQRLLGGSKGGDGPVKQMCTKNFLGYFFRYTEVFISKLLYIMKISHKEKNRMLKLHESYIGWNGSLIKEQEEKDGVPVCSDIFQGNNKMNLDLFKREVIIKNGVMYFIGGKDASISPPLIIGKPYCKSQSTN